MTRRHFRECHWLELEAEREPEAGALAGVQAQAPGLC